MNKNEAKSDFYNTREVKGNRTNKYTAVTVHTLYFVV